MSRIGNFLDFKTRQYFDTSEIIDQVGSTFKVERRAISAGKIGIDTEHGVYQFLRNVVAYVELARSSQLTFGQGVRKISNDASQGMKYTYLGITTDDDVKIGDKWGNGILSLKVQFVDKTRPGKTEVGLEVFE